MSLRGAGGAVRAGVGVSVVSVGGACGRGGGVPCGGRVPQPRRRWLSSSWLWVLLGVLNKLVLAGFPPGLLCRRFSCDSFKVLCNEMNDEQMRSIEMDISLPPTNSPHSQLQKSALNEHHRNCV